MELVLYGCTSQQHMHSTSRTSQSSMHITFKVGPEDVKMGFGKYTESRPAPPLIYQPVGAPTCYQLALNTKKHSGAQPNPNPNSTPLLCVTLLCPTVFLRIERQLITGWRANRLVYKRGGNFGSRLLELVRLVYTTSSYQSMDTLYQLVCTLLEYAYFQQYPHLCKADILFV